MKRISCTPKESINNYSMKDPLKIALFIAPGQHGRGVSKGISRYAQTHGPWTFFTIEQRYSGRLIQASSIPDSFDNFNGDGILAYTQNEKILKTFIDSGLPVVNTTQTNNLSLPAVFTNDRLVGGLVADYFINRGFNHFAFFGSFSALSCTIQRKIGFAERVKSNGFNCSSFPPSDWDLREVEWKRDHKKIIQWIQSLDLPLALFTDNDSCGQIIANICKDLNIYVPEEVAIIGTNNDELICEFSNPYLSSVMLAKEQVGFEAASLLEQLIRKKKHPPLPILIPPLGITTRRSSDIFAVEDPHVAKALNFIYHHAGELISVTDIVQHVHSSRRHLERRFREATGRSLHNEILRAHIERAKKLLAETSLPMDRIAEVSGFSEIKHFYNNFRKETGLPPTQYRKQCKKIKN